MRGRWAAFAVGRAAANSRNQAAMSQQQNQADQALQAQQREADRVLQAKNQEIERLRAAQSQQAKSQPKQEDVTEKLQKLGDLHQKGLLTDEEFSKLKMDLLSNL